MRWKTSKPAPPTEGAYRLRQRFAWWPTQMTKGLTDVKVWLGSYWQAEKFVAPAWDNPPEWVDVGKAIGTGYLPVPTYFGRE